MQEQSEGQEIRDRLTRRLTEIGRADLVPALDRLYAAVLFAPDMPEDVQRDIARLTDLRLPGAVFLTAPGRAERAAPVTGRRSSDGSAEPAGATVVRSAVATMTSMRTVVVVPTYQEASNVSRFLAAVRTAVPDADVLVVDDNSPDGTGDLAERGRRRPGPGEGAAPTGQAGPGHAPTATDSGWPSTRGTTSSCHMDVDLSHDPCRDPGRSSGGHRGRRRRGDRLPLRPRGFHAELARCTAACCRAGGTATRRSCCGCR